MSIMTADPELRQKSLQALAEVPISLLTGKDGDISVADPATGEEIATVPNHTVTTALDAVAQAESAGKQWATTTPRHRSDVLHAVYENLVENKDSLALVMSREMGKTINESYAEVQYAADYVRWFAEEALRAGGSYRQAPSGGATMITTRAPVGLSVLITPWNFPMAMATRKIAPALAAGCGCVVKPATLTPLTTYLTVKLFEDAGVPTGLIQVITTKNASAFSEAVLTDERVRKVSFTGSTAVGSTLMSLAANNIIKSSMELGGNAPLLVFDDADVDRAIEGAMLAKMRNGGQTCVSANRMFIQEGIADDFIEGFSEKMAALVQGNPLNHSVELGPVVDHRAVSRLQRLVDDATQKGADLRVGGSAIESQGSFFEATVLDNVPHEASITTTEIFGPVASITRVKTQAEAITKANDTCFGLAAFIFTKDLDRALNVAEALETGMVGINQGLLSNVAAPFGGVKQSGIGREGAAEGLEEYQEIRYFNISRQQTS